MTGIRPICGEPEGGEMIVQRTAEVGEESLGLVWVAWVVRAVLA
jgi:hypothetical protein